MDYVDNGRKARDYGNDLEDMGSNSVEIINIDTSYQPSWGPQEGFRENLQNWKDGIMRSFNINERDFKVECTDRPNEKVFAVYHPRELPKKLLGYMRFLYDDKKLGTLEITNFKATLQRRHLGIGGTTKADDAKQVGQHGEGLKLAALVNRRHPYNYAFTIYSASCEWKFGWDVDRKLTCRIERVPKTQIVEQKELAAEKDEQKEPREAKARVWEDVSVVIGEPRQCRSLKGEIVATAKIPLAEFEKWLSVSIDIQVPKDIVYTTFGNLILDPQYKNKLYIHGLLLPNGSKSGRKFDYGYNLFNTPTRRDRETTANAWLESETIFNIWQEVLFKEEEAGGKHPHLTKYTNLLRKKLDKAADVLDVDDHMEEDVAMKVWNHMRKQKKNGKLPFFYEAGSDSQDAIIIERRLKREPVALERGLWKIFALFDLCLTPRAEQFRLFNRAKPSIPTKTAFADHVMKGLQGLLALDSITAGTKIVPVDGQGLGVIVNFHDREWKIDDVWFTHEGAHTSTYCEDLDNRKVDESNHVFTCDHVILWLYDNMIHELQFKSDNAVGPEKEAVLKSMARVKIQQIPRAITVAADRRRNGLVVSWVSLEPHNKAKMSVRATLHSDKCVSKVKWENVLLHEPSKYTQCSCLSYVSTVGSETVEFCGLDKHQKYLPVISRDTQGAIYGVVPKAVSPSDPTLPDVKFTYSSSAKHVSTEKIAELFDRKIPPSGWKAISHQELFKDGFPYAHDWLTSEKPDPQIFIAKSKPDIVKADLKRALDGETPIAVEKRLKT